jgi:hypothetical protein
MVLSWHKIDIPVMLDSHADKASPMRRGTSATEGTWQNRG